MRVGLVDLDTSHARSFAARLNGLEGVKVAGVFDAGAVRAGAQVQEFCNRIGCARFDSVAALAASVDGALVLSADWDVHLERATPLLKAGVPTYVDKPLAGDVSSLAAFVSLAERTGTPLLAGSGWRFNDVVEAAAESYARSRIGHVFAMVGNDPFYYGIHLVEMVLGVLGPGIVSVQWGTASQDQEGPVWLEFAHRRGATGHLLLRAPRPFRGLLLDVDGIETCLTFSANDIHQGVCERFVSMARQKRSPLPIQDLCESCRVMLAALQSRREQRSVLVGDLGADAHYLSADFMADYVASATPTSLL